MVGGGISGGIQGAYSDQFWSGFGRGVLGGMASGALTAGAYDFRGYRAAGDGVYGKDVSKLGVADREALAMLDAKLKAGEITQEWYDYATSDLYEGASDYSCKDFANDMSGVGREVRFGSKDWGRALHVGRDIGGDLYGTRFILSKQGMKFPVAVNTSRQLSTGRWYKSNPKIFHTLKASQLPGAVYGRAYYVW